MKMSVHCVYSLQASLAKLAGHHKILRLEMATKQTADETSAGMLTNAIHDLVQGAKRRIPMLICKCVVPVDAGSWEFVLVLGSPVRARGAHSPQCALRFAAGGGCGRGRGMGVAGGCRRCLGIAET
jgi:hypothetical protein